LVSERCFTFSKKRLSHRFGQIIILNVQIVIT